jgi:hypothetical protein
MVLEDFVDHGSRLGEAVVSGSVVCERRSLRKVGAPAPAAAVGHEPLHARPLSLHELARRGAAGPQRGNRLW